MTSINITVTVSNSYDKRTLVSLLLYILSLEERQTLVIKGVLNSEDLTRTFDNLLPTMDTGTLPLYELYIS